MRRHESLPMSKRDLAKLCVTSLDQLDQPLPPGIRCKVKLTLRKDDDGSEFNRVRRFDVIGIDEPEQDTFAPVDDDNSRSDTLDNSAGKPPADANEKP